MTVLVKWGEANWDEFKYPSESPEETEHQKEHENGASK